MNPILDDIAKTSIQLMLNEPFYGHFFTSIIKDVDNEKTESVALSPARFDMLKLVINENYWKDELTQPNPEQSKQLRYGAIKHQILHLVLKHILRVQDFGDKQLFGIAADLATNQYINPNQLTPDAISIENFPDFELETQQSLDYYYHKLKEKADEIGAEGAGEGDGEEECEDCESGGGEGEDENLNPSQKKLKELLADAKNKQLEQHKNWEQIAKMSMAERKLLEAIINEAISSTMNRIKNKGYGTLPGDLQSYIDGLLESMKPTVNWRRVLRIFAATSARTYIKNTIQKASKRYGTTPGIKLKHRQRLMVAVDTSGSVSDEDLKEFFSEIYHIWKQGAEIHIVECDTQIAKAYNYKGVPPQAVHGRGGTDFNPPIEYANNEFRPDGLVYFTDGGAPAPEISSRAPILWLVCESGISEADWDFLPGRKVKMIKNQ